MFDLKVYLQKFEKEIEFETIFYERNQQFISKVFSRFEGIKGIFNINGIFNQLGSEIYAFKYLNTILQKKGITIRNENYNPILFDNYLNQHISEENHNINLEILNNLKKSKHNKLYSNLTPTQNPKFLQPVLNKSSIADEAINLADLYQRFSRIRHSEEKNQKTPIYPEIFQGTNENSFNGVSLNKERIFNETNSQSLFPNENLIQIALNKNSESNEDCEKLKKEEEQTHPFLPNFQYPQNTLNLQQNSTNILQELSEFNDKSYFTSIQSSKKIHRLI